MKIYKSIVLILFFLIPLTNQSQKTEKMIKSDKEWKSSLDEMSYKVLRNSYTERPFTGEYNLHFEEGSYSCKGCNQKLFESNNKYESNCGWPSFDKQFQEQLTMLKIILITCLELR